MIGRALVRLLVIPAMLAGYFAVLFLLSMTPRRGRNLTLRLQASRLFCRLGLKCLGIRIQCPGREALRRERPYLVVANHLSYLDVLFLHLVWPAVFITSTEIAATPFLGSLCRLAGCLFVERRSIWQLRCEVAAIAAVLRGGHSVVLFPEATTTNGAAIKAFKSSLLEAAVQAGVEVLPVCISYKSLDGRAIDSANRDRVFWYGEMTFAPHFLRLFLMRSLHVELRFLPVQRRCEYPHRKQLTRAAAAEIKRHYQPLADAVPDFADVQPAPAGLI